MLAFQKNLEIMETATLWEVGKEVSCSIFQTEEEGGNPLVEREVLESIIGELSKRGE